MSTGTQTRPLRRCPRCKYNLRGLPARHTCPECGLVYDPDCAIIRLRGWRKVDLFVAMCIGIFLAVGIDLILHNPDLRSIAGALSWAATYVVFMVGGWLMRFIMRGRFNRRAVIVNYRGVTFDTPTIPTRFFPWSDIAQVRFDWKTEQFRIDGPARTPLLICKGKDLSTNRLADECAYVINDLKGVYAENSVDERQAGDT